MNHTDHRIIQVITFDLDDTLWAVKPVLIEAEHIVFNWLDAHAPKISAHFNVDSFRRWRWDNMPRSPQLTHQISQLRIASMDLALRHVGYDNSTAHNISLAAFDIFLEARHRVTLFDEAMPMLQALHGQYILGALTNGNADVQRLDIGSLFDFSFTAEQLDASKPAADHFLAAQQTTGVAANAILHIGDNLEHDVIGAVRAGCHAIWYNCEGETHIDHDVSIAPDRYMEVDSLLKIPSMVEALQRQLAADSP